MYNTWFFDGEGNMVIGSFEENLKNLQIYYNALRRENRELKDIIQKLEADKLNDKRVRELTEEINYMKSYGFYLTPEDVKEFNDAKVKFETEHPNIHYTIHWEFSICHIGEIATCFAEYKELRGHLMKEQLCVICH